jgi:hypothetical protein
MQFVPIVFMETTSEEWKNCEILRTYCRNYEDCPVQTEVLP